MRAGTLATIALCTLVLGCGSDDKSQSSDKPKPSSGASKTGMVDIKDFKFAPKVVQVKAGGKVAFTNEDSAKHTATSKTEGVFDTGDLTQDKSKTVTLKKPGTFKFYCEYHAFMTGTVKVTR